MFLVDLWNTGETWFNDAWESTFGVPYTEFENWVQDLIEPQSS